jgi:hypothetical protein
MHPSPTDPHATLEHLWPPPRALQALPGRQPAPRTADPGPFADVELPSRLRAAPSAEAEVRLRRDARLAPRAYALEILPEGIRIAAADLPAARSALATLAQLGALARTGGGAGELPCVRIDDQPGFATRGAMLDVSRSRVPRQGELERLAAELAGWKYDELQLYTEHTFAYEGHADVWRDASPITPAEASALDQRCARLGIELVPNQQSLGHMHRWLKHARYRDLAEVPEGVEHPFSLEREPYSLCLADPRALALLEDLYDQLLPCFRSRWFNVGLDETFDLALGRSRAEAEARGVERVYLERLRLVHALVHARGRRMQFWGDVILQRPELVPELPRDALALCWGYEAGHPFERELAHFARSGLEFRVAPGTSSWQSFGGRVANALANQREAARCGSRAGAAGWLVTDWGDRGHHQPHCVRDWGLFAAAGPAWNPDCELDPARLARLLDLHLFRDRAGELGAAALELASADLASRSPARNGSAVFFLLSFAPDPFPHARTPALAPEGLEAVRALCSRARARLGRARSARDDAPLLLAELGWIADALETAAELGLARLAALSAAPGAPLGALPRATRAHLAERLRDLEARHARIWLARDREGGLSESLHWLERVRAPLEGGV